MLDNNNNNRRLVTLAEHTSGCWMMMNYWGLMTPGGRWLLDKRVYGPGVRVMRCTCSLGYGGHGVTHVDGGDGS